jgi:hypothetical protein
MYTVHHPPFVQSLKEIKLSRGASSRFSFPPPLKLSLNCELLIATSHHQQFVVLVLRNNFHFSSFKSSVFSPQIACGGCRQFKIEIAPFYDSPHFRICY